MVRPQGGDGMGKGGGSDEPTVSREQVSVNMPDTSNQIENNS